MEHGRAFITYLLVTGWLLVVWSVVVIVHGAKGRFLSNSRRRLITTPNIICITKQ